MHRIKSENSILNIEKIHTNNLAVEVCDMMGRKVYETEFENLCQACRPCNEFKGDLVEVVDPLSGQMVALFHTRTQVWNAHFEWSFDGVQIIGLTDVGRATVVALQMNNLTIVTARRRWVIAGWHPPEN